MGECQVENREMNGRCQAEKRVINGRVLDWEKRDEWESARQRKE